MRRGRAMLRRDVFAAGRDLTEPRRWDVAKALRLERVRAPDGVHAETPRAGRNALVTRESAHETRIYQSCHDPQLQEHCRVSGADLTGVDVPGRTERIRQEQFPGCAAVRSGCPPKFARSRAPRPRHDQGGARAVREAIRTTLPCVSTSISPVRTKLDTTPSRVGAKPAGAYEVQDGGMPHSRRGSARPKHTISTCTREEW